MNKRFLFFLCIMMILLPLLTIAGIGTASIEGESVCLDSYIEYFEDETGKLTIEDARNGKQKVSFVSYGDSTPNFGYSLSAYWLRFPLERKDSDRRLVLEIPYSLLDDVRFYCPMNDGTYLEKKAGRNYPFRRKEIKNRNFAFFIPSGVKNKGEYYLRVKSQDSLAVPVKIHEYQSFLKKDYLEQFVLGIYYGIIVVMLLFNLFLFLTMKDTNYIYYILTLAFLFGLFQFAINGLSFQYIGRESIWWSRTSIAFFFSLGAAATVQFSRTFLATGENLPLLDKLLIAGIVWGIIEAVLSFFIPYYIAIQSAVVMGMYCAGFIWLAGWISLVRGNRSARYYLIAWSAFVIGGLTYSLKVWSFLPSNMVTEYLWQAGCAFVTILLSIALGDRIRHIEEEKFRTQEELISSLREMDRMKGEMNRELEKKVEERTAELRRARDALWGEMELAKKIQTVLLPEKPNISGYEIAAFMTPADEVGGDYYDIINVEGMDWVVIGDVSGHGVPAGLVMMMVQTSIQVTLSQHPDLPPSDLLSVINKVITKNIKQLGEDKYMTITVLAAYKNGEFVFSGLHQDIMIFRKDLSNVQLVETRGMWIGIWDDISGMVENDRLDMKNGDVMCIFTDGITEAWKKGSVVDQRDPEEDMYGEEQLAALFKNLCASSGSVDDIMKGIVASMEDYKLSDDVTLVVLKRV